MGNEPVSSEALARDNTTQRSGQQGDSGVAGLCDAVASARLTRSSSQAAHRLLREST